MSTADFKTDEAEVLGLAGSIPVRLRHLRKRANLETADIGRGLDPDQVAAGHARHAGRRRWSAAFGYDNHNVGLGRVL